jgi:hypothetical protein
MLIVFTDDVTDEVLFGCCEMMMMMMMMMSGTTALMGASRR